MPPAVADPESGERVVKELPALMDGSAADTDTPDTSQQQQEAHKPKHVVGIIYPPPEVRNIVDKTASFVARNGPEFESRIRQNELNNPKFNFLNGGDPYHAYYQHRVEEIREGRAEPVTGSLKPLVPLQLTPQSAPGGGAAAGGGTIAAGAPGSQVRAGQEMFRPAAEKQLIVTEPPPPYEFTADPPSISSVDLDIVKLTAQFVARNGRQFLTHLMNREQRNYQFDFLRPQHSLFQYFTKLLEQYTKVLIPPKDLMAKLDLEAESPAQVLDRVRYRVEWDRVQEARKRREEEAVERERVSYAQIDWHDFVVVETVDYQPWEQGQFPPPTTPAQVGQRVLMQERIDDGEEMQMSDEEPEPEPEPEESSSSSSEEEEDEEEEEDRPAAGRRGEPERGVQDNTQVQDMEEDSDDETEEPRRQAPPPPSLSGRMQPPPPPMPPKPDQVVIKKYDPKAAAKPSRAPAPDEYLISPITGERIPASKVAEHMRIGLLDPRWVEQRDRQLNEKVNQETVFATGGDIGSHLQNLAERRTDIFGAGDEETIIGKKIGEEEKRADDKSIWDGHSSSVDATRSAARASITLDQQISHIHKAKGLMEESERIGPKKAGGRGADRRDRERERERERREREEQRDRQPPPPPPLPPTPREAPKPPPPPPASAPAPPPPPPPPPREVPKPPPPAPPAPRLTPAQPPAPPQPLLLRPQMMATPMGPQGVMLAPRPPVVMPARPMFMQPMQPMPAGFMPQMQPGPPRPPMPVRPQMPMAPEPMVPGGDDEPPNKRARTEDSLVPEQLWLARHPQGSVTFCVSVPIVTDKPEWRLSGQTLSLTMPLTELVSVLKGRLSDETGLPPGKQKLLGEGFFFKDSNSLAYYNVANGSTVQLQLKERGGRKK